MLLILGPSLGVDGQSKGKSSQQRAKRAKAAREARDMRPLAESQQRAKRAAKGREASEARRGEAAEDRREEVSLLSSAFDMMLATDTNSSRTPKEQRGSGGGRTARDNKGRPTNGPQRPRRSRYALGG